jgi:hypothetical protein
MSTSEPRRELKYRVSLFRNEYDPMLRVKDEESGTISDA